MSFSAEQTKLGDLVSIIKDTVSPNQKPDALFSVYSIPGFDKNAPERLSGKDIQSNKFFVPDNSILVSKLNPRTKRIWAVRDACENPVASTEFVVLQLNEYSLVEYDFILAILNSPKFQSFLESRVQGTSNSHQRVRPEEILEFPIPTDVNKELVGDMFFLMSKKIELNRRMNETLEQIGQALFKHYFVDNPELGEGTIGEIIDQTSEKIGNQDQKKFVVLSAVKTGNLTKSEEYFTKQVFSKDISKYKTLNKFDFAYNPARVNIGSIGMLEDDFQAAVSPVYVTFRTQGNEHFFIKELLKLKSTKSRINELCSGSVRQALRFDDFARIKIKKPKDELIEKFNTEYEVFYNAQEKNETESNTLAVVRDSLLPKLLTGEIVV